MNIAGTRFTKEIVTITHSGVDNSYPFDTRIQKNIEMVAIKLSEIEIAFRQPLHINSWYRCYELNKHVGGVSNSLHMKGLAVDIHMPVKKKEDFMRTLTKYNLLENMQETIYYDYWVHLGFNYEEVVIEEPPVFNSEKELIDRKSKFIQCKKELVEEYKNNNNLILLTEEYLDKRIKLLDALLKKNFN